jgi:hypothetical protein
MKILSILNEGLSPILYHYGNPDSILNILKTNTIKLSSSLAKNIEKDYTKGKYFYFSTTRSRVGSYHFSHGMKESLTHTAILLKLDGRALSNITTGTPTDYWGRDFRNVAPTKHEMEDRILSDKPTIPNASKYIISVECFYNEQRQNRSNARHNPIRDVVATCLELGIDVNLYLTQDDFITGKRGLKNQTALDKVNFHGPEAEPYNRPHRDSFLQPYIELMTTNDRESLSKPSLRILDDLGYSYDFNNTLQRLQADFHNSNTEDASRELTVLARKAGVKNLTELLAYIKNKFKK